MLIGEQIITYRRGLKSQTHITTTDELIRINHLKSDTDIRPGQILKIPVKKAEAPTPPPEAKPKSQEIKPNQQEKTKIIVVQQTDTLPLIAKLTGNTIDEIKKLSGLSSDRLNHNQKLKVYDRQVASTATTLMCAEKTGGFNLVN